MTICKKIKNKKNSIFKRSPLNILETRDWTSIDVEVTFRAKNLRN